MMANSAFRALLVEDNEADAFFVRKLLNDPARPDALGRFTVEAVNNLGDALTAISRSELDVVLLDLSLPDSYGLDTLRHVRALSLDLPIVVLTGSADVNLALESLTLGAQDFLQKEELSSAMIARTIRYAIERRRSQQQIVTALRDKEVLLRELNHRAKNNLQVVTSLLSMQARRSEDEGFRSLVDAARARIDSMALAHEQLHASSSLASVDFSSYLRTLADAIHRSHGGDSRGIRLELMVGKHELPLDRAVPAGLVVNELLGNAFKHAFPAERGGKILLSLTENQGRLTLAVEDDGVGLMEDVSTSLRPFGLELVATLAEQLDATFERKVGEGTRLSLEFSASGEG